MHTRDYNYAARRARLIGALSFGLLLALSSQQPKLQAWSVWFAVFGTAMAVSSLVTLFATRHREPRLDSMTLLAYTVLTVSTTAFAARALPIVLFSLLLAGGMVVLLVASRRA